MGTTHTSPRWLWPIIGAFLGTMSGILGDSFAALGVAGLFLSILGGAVAADILSTTPKPFRRRMYGGMAIRVLCGFLFLLLRLPAIGLALRMLVASMFFGGLVGRTGWMALAGAVLGGLGGGLIGMIYEVTKHAQISTYLHQVGLWIVGGAIVGTYLTGLLIFDTMRYRPLQATRGVRWWGRRQSSNQSDQSDKPPHNPVE